MTDFKKHNPFKIPDGYFESFEEKLCNSEDAVSKLNPFSTPEGYLENLENSIHKKIGISQKSAKNRLKNSTLRYTLVAAVIVFIVTLFQVNRSAEIEKEQALNEFIENYYLESFDSYEMLSVLEDNELESTFNLVRRP